ncbi:MAG: LuxR C-terminal-related transcriptional regulator [Myxococcota bacterium]
MLLTLLLGGMAVFGIIDLLLDLSEDPTSFHLVFEILFVSGCLASVAYVWASWMQTRRNLARVEQALSDQGADRDAWREKSRKLLLGLGEEISRQFGEWGLTPAEREVALLLLKGYGHKEIAALLERSERTVRQHAVAAYRKSGLSGRAELSAFFLEDLLLPVQDPAEAD